MNKIINVGPTWVYVKDITIGLVVFGLSIGFVVMQSKLQAAECRAALAEQHLSEAIIKLSDTIINNEVIRK